MFTERMQAFLAAKYYEYLKLNYDKVGIMAFDFATKVYANQRGRRMAKRAIRDGEDLTYETYCQYGEWISTDDSIDNDIANKFEFIEDESDLVMHISHCPWRFQFKSMGAEEAGLMFCKNLDRYLVEGFNSDIDYSVDLDTLQGSSDEYCVHIVKNYNLDGKNTDKNKNGLKGFDYHCAHLFWSFRETIIDIYGYEGLKISEKVLDDFNENYGEANTKIILKYRNINFNLIE